MISRETYEAFHRTMEILDRFEKRLDRLKEQALACEEHQQTLRVLLRRRPPQHPSRLRDPFSTRRVAAK